MTLPATQYDLLRLYAAAGPSESTIYKTPRPPGTQEGDPMYDSWVEEQSEMFRASVALYARGLVAVVSPANGERPDIVEVTDRGRTLLAQIAAT